MSFFGLGKQDEDQGEPKIAQDWTEKSSPVDTIEHTRFGARGFLVHEPLRDPNEPYGVCRYRDHEAWYFHYKEDAEKYLALIESGAV